MLGDSIGGCERQVPMKLCLFINGYRDRDVSAGLYPLQARLTKEMRIHKTNCWLTFLILLLAQTWKSNVMKTYAILAQALQSGTEANGGEFSNIHCEL